jgi:hypothetical protein
MWRAILLGALLAPQDKKAPLPFLDAWFEAEWKKAGQKPAEPADDAAFLRRVSLDLTGSLPAPNDVREFLKSTSKNKRAANIDELLQSPKAADYFAHLWVQWLMGHDVDEGDLRRLDFGALTRWLKDAWTKGMPYPDFVRAFLSAATPKDNPPGTFTAKHTVQGEPPALLAGMSARIFLGRDIRCAQCHDHPYEKISQDDFWAYTAFFRSPGPKPATLREDLGEAFVEPRFLDGRKPEPDEPRREALARLALDGDAVARAVVDRTWRLLFGRGLAKSRKEPGRPELLKLLTDEFVKNGQDLRWLMKTAVSSRAYQLSSEGSDAARREYAVGPLKMMNSVQFLRAWNHAFQWDVYFRQLYEKDPSKAPFFADPDVFWIGQTMQAKELLFPKGRDPEEFLAQGTDRLALKLMNNRDIQLLMIAQFGLVRKVMSRSDDPAKRLEELFLHMVGRLPRAAERSRCIEHAKSTANPYHGWTDVFWMLFNSSEFLFIG